MYANINQITLKSGEMPKEATERWRTLIQQQPGFLGFLRLRP